MRRVLKLFILTLLVVISLSGVLAGGMAAWLHNKGGLKVVLSSISARTLSGCFSDF